MRLLQIVLFVIASHGLFGQLVLDKNFDNGNLDFFYVHQDTIELPSSPFLHCRIAGAFNFHGHFFIDQGSGSYTHRYNHRMVYRYSNDSLWHKMDTGFVDANNGYHFYNNSAFVYDTVFLAYWYPFTYTDLQDYLGAISGNPFVNCLGVRDTSLLGRNIYGYCITDPSIPDHLKKKVIIQNRQHAMESPGSIVAQGISKYLVYGADTISAELKRRAVFFFYPMLNPDGVAEGGNPVAQPDHNDEWFPSCSSQGGIPSTNFEIERMRNIIWNDCSGHADFAFDIHSHPGHTGQYYWWSLVDTNSFYGITQAMCDTSLLLISRIHFHDATDHGGIAMISSTSNDFVGWPSNLTAPPADWWLNQTMGALSYTLEPGSAPTLDYSRMERIGVSIAKGLFDVLPPVSVSGFSDIKPEDFVKIYPNPTTGYLKVTGSDISCISIVDVHGRLILERELSDRREVFDFRSFPKGIYLVKIVAGSKLFVRKVIFH